MSQSRKAWWRLWHNWGSRTFSNSRTDSHQWGLGWFRLKLVSLIFGALILSAKTAITISQGSECGGGWGCMVGSAFYDTKNWMHYRLRMPAVIKETSFLKSSPCWNSQSGCWKITNIDIVQQYLTPS